MKKQNKKEFCPKFWIKIIELICLLWQSKIWKHWIRANCQNQLLQDIHCALTLRQWIFLISKMAIHVISRNFCAGLLKNGQKIAYPKVKKTDFSLIKKGISIKRRTVDQKIEIDREKNRSFLIRVSKEYVK